MKKKIFSKGLFIEALRRLKAVTIISLAVIVFDQVVLTVVQNAGDSVMPGGTLSLIGPADIMASLIYIPVIIAPLMMLILFAAFNKRSSSDFYLALPFSRDTLAFTWTLAAVVISFALTLAGALLGCMAYAFYPELYVIVLGGFVSVLSAFFAAICFAAGAVLIAVSLTGKIFSGTTLALLIMYLPRYLMVVVTETLFYKNPILTDGYVLKFFSLKMNVLVGLVSGVFEDLYNALFYGDNITGIYFEAGPIVYTLLVGLAFIGIGILLFERRRSEIAQQAAANKGVNAAVRIAVGLTVSSVGTFLIILYYEYGYAAFETAATAIYIAALLAYLAYELISTGKWKNLLRSLPSLLIVAALNVILAVCVWAGGKVVRVYVTDYNSINAVTLQVDEDSQGDLFETFLSQATLTDSQTMQMVQDAAQGALYAYGVIGGDLSAQELSALIGERNKVSVVRAETDKGTRFLKVRFTEAEYKELINTIINSEEYLKAARDIPKTVDKTASVKLTLYSYSSSSRERVPSEAEILDELKSELKALDDDSLRELALESVLGDYSDSCIYGVYFRSAVPGFEEYGIGVSPLYFPTSAEMIFDFATFGDYDANIPDEILEIYETKFTPYVNAARAASGSEEADGASPDSDETDVASSEGGETDSAASDSEEADGASPDSDETDVASSENGETGGEETASPEDAEDEIYVLPDTLAAVGAYFDLTVRICTLEEDGNYNIAYYMSNLDSYYDYENGYDWEEDSEEYIRYEYYEDEGVWEILEALKGTEEELSYEKFVIVNFNYFYGDGYAQIHGILPLTEEALSIARAETAHGQESDR